MEEHSDVSAPIPAAHFTLPKVAEGAFTRTAAPAAPVLCDSDYAGALTVDGDETATVALPNLADASGNSCAPAAYSWINGVSPGPVSRATRTPGRSRCPSR
ncbi:hypothetical protein LRD69_05020 [Streptomyces sp. JH14]|uniref:hypothetical protein n=1 Tax=Streptomyces sp. JH14 TaxID=2793630 RepID=UPI0023F7EBE5|nr:hypothetical protein [Streptomyces sp. JH14]MDF6041532.1 hypothetical protein [Streptomyces sp. JH14]